MRYWPVGLFVICFVLMSGTVESHVCNDVLPGGSQYKQGCEPVVISLPGGLSQNRNQVSFTIRVENRQTPYSPATSCGNSWSGTLTNVRISNMAVSPSSGSSYFSYTSSPSSASISINGYKDFSVTVTVNPNAPTNTYTLDFTITPGSYAGRHTQLTIDWVNTGGGTTTTRTTTPSVSTTTTSGLTN